MKILPLTVIYIVGAGHSGSTLIDILLGGHSQIVSLGECERIASSVNLKLKCACGAYIDDCVFWKKWISEEPKLLKLGMRRLTQTTASFLRGDPTYTVTTHHNEVLRSKEIISEYIRFTESMFNYVAKETGNNVLVDSSKNVYRVELLTKETKLKPLIVHLVRDVRGVVASGKSRYNQKTFTSIKRWIIENIKVHILAIRLREKRLFIRYEDFVLNPMKHLNRITKAAGLSTRDRKQLFVDYARHQPAGNRLRFTKITNVIDDKKWEKELSFWDSVQCICIAGLMSSWYHLESKFFEK